jgi:hypothetical protein
VPASVPEPSTQVMSMISMLAGLRYYRLRRKRTPIGSLDRSSKR